jgi:peptidoglycan/LPS O-acetylase OafA/YrhL
MQVVLLHFVTGFLPETASHAPPPLRVLFDGHTAVYVFFVISGAVLTPSFAKGGGWFRHALKRIVRLGIPVAVAATLALALIAAMPNAHRAAAAITGSAWLAMDSSGAPTFLHLLREIFLDSLLLGFREYTLFAPFADRLPPLETALDAPFWSLHLELYGSFLVLALTLLRGRSRWAHRGAVVLCAVLFGTHPMFLFVAGHLWACWAGRTARPGIGLALILLGLLMSMNKDWPLIEAIRIVADHASFTAAPNLYQFQSQLAAVALFAGVGFSAASQRLLSSAPCTLLGRLSFSVYLVHFPILFTASCVVIEPLAARLPYTIAVALTFIATIAVTILAAALFERWIDRAAIRAARAIGPDGGTRTMPAYSPP